MLKSISLSIGRGVRVGCAIALLGVFLTAFAWAQPQDATPGSPYTLPSYIDPNEIRRGVPMGGVPGKSREQVYYERIIQKYEPTLVGDPGNIVRYIEAFKQTLIVDSRLFPFEVEGERLGERGVRLKGFVGFRENSRALVKFLHYLGFEPIEERIEVLPSSDVGVRRFAFVKASHRFTYDKAVEPREPMTEVLLGDPVFLLKKAEGGQFLCQSSDGYVGFIDGGSLRRVDEKEFTRYQSGPQAYLLRDYQADDLFIPMGARLKWVADESDTAIVEVPSAGRFAVPKTHLQVRSGEPSERVEHVIEIAKQLLDTKYVWSGKTIKGVDCSGLIQSSFKAEGINLPRDSYQQSYMGALTATRWYRGGLRRGDTLYFLGRSGRINHTAIYLGDGQYLEASGRDVHYTSFNPEDENYNEKKDRSFCFAKRLLE